MKRHGLDIKNLQVSVDGRSILQGVSLSIHSGEIHAVMGPNGSGKSTLAYALMGHPQYEVNASDGMVAIDNESLLDLPPEERAKKGLFLAFQSPIAIPGVTVSNLLRSAYQELYGSSAQGHDDAVQNPVLKRRWNSTKMTFQEFSKQLKRYANALAMDEKFFARGIHDGFSGGEKKKLEILQALMLEPKFAIFDEIDTGLDVDALKYVSEGIQTLVKKGTGCILVTHYQRILQYVKPDVVHVLVRGKIVDEGGPELAEYIEQNGYRKYV